MAIITADTVPSIRAGGSHFPGHRSAFFLKSWNTCYTRYTKITCDLACKELWGNISCRRWTTPKHVSRGWISQQFAYDYSVFRHVQWSERQPFQHSSEYVTSFCSWLVFWCQCLSLSLSLSLFEKKCIVLYRFRCLQKTGKNVQKTASADEAFS